MRRPRATLGQSQGPPQKHPRAAWAGPRATQETPRRPQGPLWAGHETPRGVWESPPGVKKQKNAVLSTISGFSAHCDFGAVQSAPRGAREVPRAPRGPPRSRQESPRTAQEGPTSCQERPRGTQGGPRGGPGAAQGRPRRRPRGPKGAKRARMGPRRVQNGSPEGPRSVQNEDRRDDKGDDVPKGRHYSTL